MLPSAAELIARYLRSNGYTEVSYIGTHPAVRNLTCSQALTNFVREAGLPSDVGTLTDDKITIESIIREKKTFDLSLSFEKLGVDDEHRRWTGGAPTRLITVSNLLNRSNILSISVVNLSLSAVTGVRPYIAVTTANRQLHLIYPGVPDFELVQSYSSFQDSPSLDVVAVDSRYLLVASMSGKLTLLDVMTGASADQRQDHTKYLVKIAVYSSGSTTIVATAGWDAKIFLYRLAVTENTSRLIPFADLVLPSIPETIVFLRSPENVFPILLVARRDSTFLYYYSVDTSDGAGVVLLGQQNLAPHSNAWVAFTPADVQICPTDPQILAVATGSTPHMKVLVVKVLLPPSRSSPSMHDIGPEPDIDQSSTQASQARAELVVADHEERAILLNVNTLASQTTCT